MTKLSGMNVLDQAVKLSGEALFSFVYDGKSSKDIIKNWKFSQRTETIDDNRTKNIFTYTDPITGLEAKCEAIVYSDYPAVEWVIYFTNTGNMDTPIIQDVQAIDTLITADTLEPTILHHSQGSLCNDTDFLPHDDPINKGEKKTLTTSGGRSSQNSLPFYNIQLGSEGLIIAIGWSGQWVSSIERLDDGINIRAGMELTYLRLHPGENIHSPRILIHYWKGGDWLVGQNVFRQFMLSYHHPRHNGEPVVPPICACGSWIFAESTLTTEEKAVNLAKSFISNGIYCENFWMDAGWYSTVPSPDWWSQVGTWKPDSKRFPNGLGPVADRLHEMGLGYLLWFEPERVGANTDIAREHPEWVWGGVDGGLFKLGDPDACQWLTDYLVNFIKENGIAVYRQDFNMDPLSFWRNNDKPERQGMNEIRHIENLYKFWDDLLERVPGLYIDNCASGGRRLDLELISRSVALWRTDAWDSTSGIHTMLNLYFSGHSGGVSSDDKYTFRTRLGAGVNMPLYWDVENWTPKFRVDEIKKCIEELRELRPLWHGDFYPLTVPTDNMREWIAYQIHRDDLGRGAIVAFRRPESPYPAIDVKLHKLLPDVEYRAVFKDNIVEGKPLTKMMKGDELANLTVVIGQKRDSAVITYERI